MPTPTTVGEAQEQLRQLNFEKAILSALSEHVDQSFLSHNGVPPLSTIVTEEYRLPVPETSIENVLEKQITNRIQAIDGEISTLLAASLQPPPPLPIEPTPTPTPQGTPS